MNRHAAPDQPGVAPLRVDGQISVVAVPPGAETPQFQRDGARIGVSALWVFT